MSSKIIPAEETTDWEAWSFSPFFESASESVQEESSLKTEGEDGESDPVEEEGVDATPDLAEREQGEPVIVETVEIEPASIYPTAAEIEALHQEAFQAGYEAGHKTGFETGQRLGLEQSELAVRAEFAPAFESFLKVQEKTVEALGDLDKKLATTILDLALDCARRIVAREIKVNETAILGVISQAVAILPEDMSQAKLRLNPEDIAAVQRYSDADAQLRSWKLIADPEIERGGCLVETPTASLDLTLKQRWKQLFASLGVKKNAAQQR